MNPKWIRWRTGGMIAAVGSVVLTTWIGSYSWFLGCGLGFAVFYLLEKRRPMISALERDLDQVTEGTRVA